MTSNEPMTPAPISVERLPEKWRRPPTKAGVEWIEANARRQCAYELEQALPALLQRLAEREAEVANLREAFALKDAAFKLMRDAAQEYKARACAAERAREEAIAALRTIDGMSYHELVCGEHNTVIAAFLAASGGA